jgi:hypothetical protein
MAIGETNSKTGMKRADKIHAAALLMMTLSAIGLYFAAKHGLTGLSLILLVVFVGANLLEFSNK